jgi:hypothetical protein
VRRVIALLALLAVSVPFQVFAEDETQFAIRFFDKKVYFLGDEILIEATITNTTTEVMSFSIADNRAFSIDFDVRTTTNLALGHAREFITARSSDQPVFFRDVSLQPGERYSVTMDLSKYAAIADAGVYVVQGQFFPRLWRSQDSQSIKSNRLTISVNPAVVTAEERAVVESQSGVTLTRQALAPDDVVTYTIQARQRSEWNRFFLYLDLESIMRKNPDKDRVWRRSTAQAQAALIEQFRQQLMAKTIDQDILLIPSTFTVQKTSYTETEATVQVLERFAHTDFTELKQYTYYLKKSDRFWIIYDYEIKNMGTQ